MLNLSRISIEKKISKEDLNTLEVLQTPRASKLLAKILSGIFLILLLAMFLPWQQNIRGYGKVTALTPENRPQMVETTIAGRIENWRIQEGQYVSKGDTLMMISEVKEKFFDPQLLQRLREQIDAKESSIQAKEAKARALENQITALKNALKFKLEQADNKVRQSELKVQSDSIDFEAEKINYKIAQDQFNRFQILYDTGNISLNKFQEYELKLQESRAKVVAKENKYLNAQNDLAIAIVDLSTLEADAMDKISKAQSDLEATKADLFDAYGSLAKLNNEYSNMEIRSNQYHIMAPQDGYIVKAMQAGIGETIKEGEAVVTIMPDKPDVAVELYVRAMDVPLLSKGRHVRLEFDGWPALQFSGWPNVAVGTFGGRIEVIDYVNSDGGKYRILIVPDERSDESWPEQLRLGSGVYGWAMLDEVPIWYEIWRQLNGFPPSLQTEPETDLKEGNKALVKK
ncbi:MAG: HlyD family secretion protein [Candidatus Cyclobacteriaceae bacterium M3_2C_046]